ncbi:MBG domain-containing protein [Pseudomonas sp. LABIM340]|uniref:MBG domain-containing protein n=1 Tax=Pseudomonas sp. LABIM340 TaxID=3156585 RepID=UPI0032AF0D91
MNSLPLHTHSHGSCPSRLRVLCIAVALASAGLPLTVMASDALPQGGSIISGSGNISQNGAEMTVNTNSSRTAINWQRFSVGADNRITFNQPDGKSVTLNRVIGSDPSKIYGAVTSNGQLILVNPNGVWIGPKAHISSSALVASAGFLTEEQAKQFAESGKLDIQLTGNVTNQGRITVHDNGMVALLGAQVNNAGVIQARKGMVQLATGPQATLDFHGDGLLNIAVSGEPGEKDSVNSDVTGGVHNSGEIDVGNGTVAMSAARAAKHLDSVINVGGNVVADSVSTDGGTVVLGSSAKTNVTGSISVTGVNGGQIKVLGDEVNVAGSAKLDASGTQGAGGKVLVGGSYQGKGSEQAASSTTVAKGAQLKADGKTDGGQVVVWSDGKTHFAGNISAQGGQKGGEVETSGKQLTVTQDAQVNAAGGQQSGKWLLDPETVTVDSTGNPDTVSAASIASALKTNDVEISASNRINVNEAIVAQDAGYHVLKLMANGTAAPISVYDDSQSPFNAAKRNDSGSVYINAPILLKDGHLFILATGDVMLNNTTQGVAGDAGYMGRAIIDVSNGTIWIKTSSSASVIQQQGTALIGKDVAVQGSSVLLDSYLNYAGTLAGKATNGKFIYNQTSNGPVNTGKVQITQDGLTQSVDGVTSETLSKVGEQWIWERNGRVTHHLTIDDSTEFQYLVFEALGYVDHKQYQPIPGDTRSNDYWVSDLTFTNPSTGDTWKIGTNNSNGQIMVTLNGAATTELPPGFSFGTNQGTVTASQNGFGVTGGSGDQNNAKASNSINLNGATGVSDQLVVDLGTSTSAVDANLSELKNQGNNYQAGKISFLAGKDTTSSGGVQLGTQSSAIQGQVQDTQREYGEKNPEFSAAISPAGNSEAFAVDQFVDKQLGQDRFSVTPSTTAAEHSNVGQYKVDGTLNAEGIMAQRHQAAIGAGTLTITPAELTVRADSQSKTYGDKDPGLSYSVDGTKLGQSAQDLLNAGALSRQAGENVGDYGISQGDLGMNNGLGGNYTLKFVDGQLQIVPAHLVVTAGSKTVTYDGTTHVVDDYTAEGLKNGDSILSASVYGQGRNAGTYSTGVGAVAVGDAGLSLDKTSNYIISFANGMLTVLPARLDVTVENASKTYGDTDPGYHYSVTGLVAGDQLGPITWKREAGENVGEYGISLGSRDQVGADANNYIIHFSNGVFTITPATLQVQADGKTKAYGDLDPRLSYTLSGLKRDDQEADVVSGELTRQVGENAGTYSITQGSVGLTAGAGSNYLLQYHDGDFVITPVNLQVAADSRSKVYGDVDPSLSYKVTGLKNGDQEADVLKGALARQAGENVGNYGIQQGDVGLTDAASGNYVFTFVGNQLAITPATLTVEATNGGKVYGDADPSLSHVVSGLKGSDTEASVLNGGAVARQAGENVGDYGIGQGSLDLNGGIGSNYILDFKDGVFTITPAQLTVTADGASKIYGDADPALSYRVDGLKGADIAADVMNSGSLARQVGEDVGKYGINQGSVDLNGAAGKNYVLHYEAGTFSITPATLVVTADGSTKVYGDFDPKLTYSVSGLKNGDTSDQVVAGKVARDAGENVGQYTIRQGDVDLTSGRGQNYVLSFANGTFTVTPATLEVTADSHTKVYGNLDPTLSYTVKGLKGTDSVDDVAMSGALSRTAGENVGNYSIGKGDLAVGENSNYVLSFVNGNLAITPATLTVKADDVSKVYGDVDPSLSHVISGLKNGDTEASVLKGALGREAGEDVRAGGYTIHQGSLGLNNGQGSNYVLEFENGTLTVTPARLNVTANNDGKVYGELDPTLTLKVDGLKGPDKETEILAGQLARQTGEDVKEGGYAINQGTLGLTGKAAQNYILTYEAGNFTITPATLMVRADDKTKVYGEIDPALSYQVSGLKRGDDQASVLGGNVVRQAGEDVKAGGYAIGQGDLASTSQNYILHYEDGTFTITPASLQIDFDDHSKVYGEIDPALTYRVNGLKNGDTKESVMSGQASRAAGENVGNYTIGQGSLGANGNYILTFNEGKLAITPAELTVTADHMTKVYGDLDPTLTYSISGLKHGDTQASVTTGSLARISGENVMPEGYAITQGNVTLTSGNYRMVFRDGNLQVTPAPLVVTADNQSKVQGAADPTLTWNVSGLKGKDQASIAQGSLQRAPGEEAGTYGITQDQAFGAGNNYTVTFRDGALTITGPLAPVPPEQPGLPPLPMTAQSPGNARCTALESPSAASASYSVSPAVVRSYAVQLVCKPRSYDGKASTTPNLTDVLTYANSLFKDGHFIVPEATRSVIPHDLKPAAPTTKGGK